jgi:microcystin-dependent protein
MGEPFVGEIRMFGGNFAPAGWAFCQGQLMPISENDTLFNLIGTTYGGDGQETFAMPDLQGRVPIHAGTGQDGITYQLGEKAGVESVTLTTNQIPIHNHAFLASTALVNANTPQNNVLGQNAAIQMYIQQPPSVNLANQALAAAGGSQPHDNMQPYLCISFIISLFGVFPSQN